MLPNVTSMTTARCICALLGALLQVPGTFAQQIRPLPVEDALASLSFSDYSPIEFSPDGRLLAYAVQDSTRITSSNASDESLYAATGVVKRVQASDVWISNSETGAARNLTGSIGDNWRPTWSPDGRYLAFLSTRDGSGQTRLWLWDREKNQLRQVSNRSIRPTLGSEIVWLPDSHGVLITTVPEGISMDAYLHEVSTPPGDDQPQRIENSSGAKVTVYRSRGIGAESQTEVRADLFNLKAKFLHDLQRIDVITGESTVVVHAQLVEWFALCPDGLHVAYSRPKKFLMPGSPQLVYDLINVNLSDLSARVLVSDVLLDGAATWSPLGSWLAYRACAQSCDYYAVAASGGSAHKLSSLPANAYNGAVDAPFWDSRGQNLYFVFDGALWRSSISGAESREVARIAGRQIVYRIAGSAGTIWSPDQGNTTIVITYDHETKQDGFYRIDFETGASIKILEDGQCYTCTGLGTDIGSYLAAVSHDGERIAYFAEDAAHPPDLWISDRNFHGTRRLTHLNPKLDEYKMGSSRLVSWFSDDGSLLKGAVLLPSDYRPGTPYPLVVWVYRGDSLSDRVHHFGLGEYPGPLNLQMLATRGYAVLCPDASEEVGFTMAGLDKSVLPGINRLVELGIADPDRLAVMGHSGGGYSTLALIVQTKRFKAAIDISGFGNFLGLYGAMVEDGTANGYREGEVILGGSPWQVRERYLENSPVLYLDRVETPLLIVHGSRDDSAVAPFLAEEVFADMRRLGKQAEFAKYEGESHTPQDWSYPNQVDLSNRIIEWLDRYLRPEHPEPTILGPR